jgi:hypothetical protein
MVAHLLAGAHASRLEPPVNVLRLSLDPLGLAPNIINLTQWRGHLFERLSHQIAATADPALISLNFISTTTIFGSPVDVTL